jgi:glycerate kinase
VSQKGKPETDEERKALLDADVVVTGEGAFDATSLRGKVATGVAGWAQPVGIPCVVVAGRVEVGRRDAAAAGIDDLYAVTDVTGSAGAAVAAGADGVTAAAARAAKAWSRRG